MSATYIKTMGMKCDACGALVEKALSRLPGVMSVRSDRRRGLTEVVFDSGRIDQLEISDEISRLGFRTRTVNYPQLLDDPLSLEEREPEPAGEARTDVHVIHVRTEGLQCDECTALVERTLSHLDGVMDVTSVRSLGLTSVLFDQSLVGRETIVEKIRGVGFGADVA
jgi:copper chaperone CopZ